MFNSAEQKTLNVWFTWEKMTIENSDGESVVEMASGWRGMVDQSETWDGSMSCSMPVRGRVLRRVPRI